jgi:CRP-like cAMP-binding protein
MGIADFLAEYKTFGHFEEADLAAVSEECTEAGFKKDETIFPEESPGDRMYIIRQGSVKVFKKIKNNETTLAIVNPGEFFGEMALLDGGPRSAAAKAIEDVKALVISTKNFEAMREKSPQVALRIMDVLVRTLSTRLRQANKNLEVISFWID